MSQTNEILDLNQDVFAQAERNDAALEKYAGYGEDRFPEPWKTDYKTLLQQIEEYKNNGQEKGSLVTIERVMVDHYIKGMGTDRLLIIGDEICEQEINQYNICIHLFSIFSVYRFCTF